MVDELKPEVKPGHGGWVPKKKTPLWAALAMSVIASVVPVLAMPEFNWRVAAAAVLSGFSVGLAGYFGMASAGPRNVALALFGVLMLSSCSADPAIVTGLSLKTAKITYHATVKSMDLALQQGLITPEQYHRFRVFSDYFDVAFEKAAGIFAAALVALDKNNEMRAGAIMDDLLKQLEAFNAKPVTP
jgi:hypothetical protein